MKFLLSGLFCIYFLVGIGVFSALIASLAAGKRPKLSGWFLIILFLPMIVICFLFIGFVNLAVKICQLIELLFE